MKMKFKKSERGQSIVLIALMFVGLLAFIGLTVDVGVLFISYGNLRQAVDNAALAASTQMRTMYEVDQLKASATQFLRLNNVDVSESSVNVQTCKTTPGDPQLCIVNERRKLVRVTATVPVKFSFLPIIGIGETNITATAIGEAASLDVVLVIDISESMAFDGTGNDRDPKICNAGSTVTTTKSGATVTIPGNCMPFTDVKKAAALTFASNILDKPESEEEDRLSIVVFSNGWQNPDLYYQPAYASGLTIPTHGTAAVCPAGYNGSGECDDPWTSDYNVAYDLITHLKVYESDRCPTDYYTLTSPYPCARYEDVGGVDTYLFPDCGLFQYTLDQDVLAGVAEEDAGDSSTCLTTNIGGGLKVGASMFSGMTMRKDSLWLVVILTDGAANATEVNTDTNSTWINTYSQDPNQLYNDLSVGYCPPGTENDVCHDDLVSTRHIRTNAAYDADDFARDMADLVACDAKSKAPLCSQAGQGALLFSVGLGSKVVTYVDADTGPDGPVPFGDAMLRYAANVGEDGDPDPATDACDGVAVDTSGYSCGNYYFTNNSAELEAIFEAIASRVFTRLAK